MAIDSLGQRITGDFLRLYTLGEFRSAIPTGDLGDVFIS
jgi:hypothetical protein